MNELRRGEAGLAMMCSADSGMTYGQWMPMGPQDELAHFGIKGMKHGRRRYQTESGEWTPLGMKERRAREGFGEGKSGGGKNVHGQGAKTKAANDAKKRSSAKSDTVNTLRNLVSGKKSELASLSDAQLQARIKRIKMEQEYMELTKSPARKLGEKLVQSYLEAKAHKQERVEKQDDFVREMKKMQEQTKQVELKSKADKARAEADKARAETDAKDIEKGTRMVENKAKLLGIKKGMKDVTVRGGIGKMVNRILTGAGSSHAEKSMARAKAYGIDKQNNAKNRGTVNAAKANSQSTIIRARGLRKANRIINKK